ncbi:MAG: hypothetical protein ACK2TX_01945, partial [Anaerolineales bacterium]
MAGWAVSLRHRSWSRVVSGGFDDPDNAEIVELAVFGGQIYAATWSYSESKGTEIWRSPTGDNGDWNIVVDNGFGNSDNIGIPSLTEYNSYLFAGVGNTTDGGGVMRSATGAPGDWNPVSTPGFGDAGNTYVSVLAPFNGKLYAATHHTEGSGAEVWRCSLCDGTDWEQVIDNGLGNSDSRLMPGFEVFDDRLYLAVGNLVDGMQVWQTNEGDNWYPIAMEGFYDSDNWSALWDYSLVEYEGHLYLGTWNPANGGEIWRRMSFGAVLDPTADAKQGHPGETVDYLCFVPDGEP